MLDLDVATEQDIQYRKGKTFKFSIDATDASATDFNFTGYSAEFVIFDSTNNKVLRTLNSGTEITLTTGNIAINAGLFNFGPIAMKYELNLTSSGGEVSCWMFGKLIEVGNL